MSYHTLEVCFYTSQEQYAVPETPFSVSSQVDHAALNTLVNKLLEESRPGWEPVEFNFLIGNEFLRGSVGEHLGPLAGEGKVAIEYVESQPAPEPQDYLLHDDWVSAIEVLDKWILTGCYDNTLHIWSPKGAHNLSFRGHDAPVKGVSWVGSTSFVSASCDQTAKIWKWDQANSTAKCMFTCRGHERSLTSIAVSPNKQLMATGCWDCMLKIWSTGLNDVCNGDEGEIPAKKVKKHDKSITRTPVLTLKGHQGVVSSTVWTDTNEICTASGDHTLRLWDVDTGSIKLDLAFNKAFCNVDWSQLNHTLLSASADRHIRLHDLRSRECSQVKTMFTNHTKLVSSVRWSKTNENLFISGALDNEVKLWDQRSFKTPLYNFGGHEDQVLCCDWTNPEYIVSGGADKTVHIFKAKHAIK